jgi:hypothetical protein
MKRVVKLTEAQLEMIVKRVISEQSMGVAFVDEQNGLKIKKEETKEQQAAPVQSQKQQILAKWNSMFPDKTWYQTARGTSSPNLNDANMQKTYAAYRKFFDNTVPDLKANEGSDFFDWMQSKGGLNNVRNNINSVASLHLGLLPILVNSNYPNTVKFKEAFDKTIKFTDPKLKENMLVKTNRLNTLEKAYDVITQMGA